MEGCPDDDCGVIDAPIGKEDAASIRRIVTASGKPSVTHYRVLKRGKTRTLVELTLETGRTHQIRVHMASIRRPVVGDFLYGTEIPQLPGRFAPHASALTLHHPMTGIGCRLPRLCRNRLRHCLTDGGLQEVKPRCRWMASCSSTTEKSGCVGSATCSVRSSWSTRLLRLSGSSSR